MRILFLKRHIYLLLCPIALIFCFSACATAQAAQFDYDEYVRAFNTGNDEGLVERFFAEDCVMYSSGNVYHGRKGLKEFLAWAHDGVREILRPQVVLQDDKHLLAEIDMDFVASKVRDDFPFAKLRPGDVITVKFLVAYTLRDGMITELKSMTWPANRLVTKEPLLGSSPGQRAAFRVYTSAFSQAEYAGFSKFYTEDVVLELPSLPPIHGRQGIVDFYSKMFPRVRETLEINQLIIETAVSPAISPVSSLPSKMRRTLWWRRYAAASR